MKDSAVNADNVLEMFGLDLDTFKTVIEKAKEIETDERFFANLSAIAVAKKVLKDALEVVESYERDAKGLIGARAKALYGKDWKTIKGEHFKITRSFSGNVYEIINEDVVEPDMVKVAITPNKETIDTYRETHDNKLPEGVALNEHRGESLRIDVK